MSWYYEGSTLRELCMLAFMNEITDKPSWHTKVFDEVIVAKWKEEALEFDWDSIVEFGDFTEAMFEYVSIFDNYPYIILLRNAVCQRATQQGRYCREVWVRSCFRHLGRHIKSR